MENDKISKEELVDKAKEKTNSYPLTIRASYNKPRLSIVNTLSHTYYETPENKRSGSLTFNNLPDISYSYDRENKNRNNDFNYNGSLYWVHPKDYAVDYSHNLSVIRRNYSSLLDNKALNYPIVNNAIEDLTQLKFNLYGLKAFNSRNRLRAGARLTHINDKIHYLQTGFYDRMYTTFFCFTTQYSLSTQNIRLSLHPGLGYETTEINSHQYNSTTPFGNINLNYMINKTNSISAYASVGANSPSVNLRQDAVVRYDEFLYLTGNAGLHNYTFLETNVAYNWFQSNRFSLAVFAGYNENFNRIATIYTPYNDGKSLLRSYINNGNYIHGYLGFSVNTKLFDNKLQLFANVTQNMYYTTGIYSNSYWPLIRIQLQASYNWKSFYALASYVNKESNLTENSNIIIHRKPLYLIEAGWGNGSWVVSLSAKNIFNKKWVNEKWEQQTPLYNQSKTCYSPNAHASINLSVTYTIGYGKKIRQNNEIGAQTSGFSGIIKQ